jgi:hypothetical protein
MLKRNPSDADPYGQIDIEGTAVETYAAFQQRRGKWATEVSQVLVDPIFVFLLQAAHTIPAPMMRLFNAMQKAEPLPYHASSDSGMVCDEHPQLAQLVYYRAQNTLDDLEDIFRYEACLSV